MFCSTGQPCCGSNTTSISRRACGFCQTLMRYKSNSCSAKQYSLPLACTGNGKCCRTPNNRLSGRSLLYFHRESSSHFMTSSAAARYHVDEFCRWNSLSKANAKHGQVQWHILVSYCSWIPVQMEVPKVELGRTAGTLFSQSGAKC